MNHVDMGECILDGGMGKDALVVFMYGYGIEQSPSQHDDGAQA